MPLRRTMNKRGGAKRKRAEAGAEAEPSSSSREVEKEEEEVKEEAGVEEKKKNYNKRAKKSSPEPEYLEDQRNLEDLWKSAFPVGTEWDLLDKVYEFNWNFSNLEAAFEEGGVLYGKKVYLFGCSEAPMVPVKGKNRLVYVPAVVAVVSPFPPSDKIGITSVQSENEEIVPMKQMKMDWTPYIPPEERDSQLDRLKSQIFTLTCNQRRVSLRHMKIDRVKKFDYCLPYFYNPLLDREQETVVEIVFPAEPKPVVCDFDWKEHKLEEFTNGLIEDEDLSEDQKDAFMEFVKEEVRVAKKANREAEEARQKTLQEMSEETRRAYKEIKVYKFYPVETSDTPDISKYKDVPFINRYYGKAHQIVL